MTKKQLLDVAKAGYPLQESFENLYDENGNEKDEPIRDMLAAFIIAAILDSYEEQSDRADQIESAIGVMMCAVEDLNGVIDALHAEYIDATFHVMGKAK